VHEAEKLSLGQIQAFLSASETIRFEGETQAQNYHWIEQVLGRQEYHQQNRSTRGLLRNYVTKMTSLSRAQVTRLIARYRKTGALQSAPYRRHHFPQRYTRADIELLAIVDEAHDNLGGPATRRILQREYRRYGKREFERFSHALGVAPLQPAPAAALSRTSSALRQDPAHRHRHRRTASARSPGAARVSARRQPSIKAIRPEGRASITSMLSMRSRNGKSFLPAHALVRPGWSRCWKPCCDSFPSAFSAFTPITAASSSIA
jgi:transposase